MTSIGNIHRLVAAAAIASILGLAVGVAVAAPVGSGVFRVEGDAVSGDFCVLFTADDLPYTVFGTGVNVGTSAGAFLCVGNNSGGNVTGHCDSTPDNTQFSYDFHITSQANKGAGFAFVGDLSNLTGLVPTAIGGGIYTFDGTASTGYQPLAATTIPGCPVVANSYFTGITGINVFRNATVTTGPATVNAAPSYTNPDTGQIETLAVDIDFADVTGGGTVLVTATSSIAGEIPSSFTLDAGGYRPSFFDISTDATITPPITICQHYADSAPDDGIVDGTTLSEDLLTLLHGEGMPVVFTDRTVSRDPVNNIVCAEVDHLSPFVIAAAIPTNHDSAVLPIAPVKINIGASGVAVTKNLKVKVQNADLTETPGHSIQLSVSGSTCPTSLLRDAANQPVTIDFDPKSPAVGDTITVAGNKVKVATIPLRAVAADYTSPNAKSPVRCTLTFTATSIDAGPVAETNPSNNTISVPIDVIDKSDF